MSDTVLQTSEANVIPNEDNIILREANVIPSAASVIRSAAKDLPPSQAPTDLDTLELDLALEDELIIEDFTIDGICGVY